ncbi:uncharacterized protein LOC116417000 [Nasonia vitripennis]|uniref:BEN domain-containing protein n=1 Tax=Nasonia vitripennis TaxID=7425 RepID=A0A7M7Q981_NASVI|nr:uncharacterized protein LOC116417000 [Nasonia vitripennis]
MDEELTTNNNTTETREENNDESQSQLDNMEEDLSNKSRLQLLNNKENGNESIRFKSDFPQFIEKQKTNDNETEFVKKKISRKETEYKVEIQTDGEQSKENKIQVVQTKSDKIKPKIVRNEMVNIPFQDLIKIKMTASETKKKVPENFQSDNEVPALQTDGDISTLKNTIKKLKSENAQLEKRKKELKLELEEKVKEIKRLMDLNENLQNHLIEKCEEQKDEIRKLANGKESTNDGYDSNFPSFLRTRTTDNIRRVHIGNDEWIPEIAYNRINTKSATARQLAGNILIAVFDEEILLTSTITGNESNKKGKGNRNSVKKLDEKKSTHVKSYMNIY